jgi:hypothetical protein
MHAIAALFTSGEHIQYEHQAEFIISESAECMRVCDSNTPRDFLSFIFSGSVGRGRRLRSFNPRRFSAATAARAAIIHFHSTRKLI